MGLNLHSFSISKQWQAYIFTFLFAQADAFIADFSPLQILIRENDIPQHCAKS